MGVLVLALRELYKAEQAVKTFEASEKMKIVRDYDEEEKRAKNMDTISLLEELKIKARNNPDVKEQLLATRTEKNPVDAFCRKCQELGYPIYEMDLINAGEEFYATMKRSTNGGGENSPILEGQDDFYEMFFADM